MTQTAPEIGQLVLVRRRPFVVMDVQAQGIPGDSPEQSELSHLVKLSSVEDDSLGEELEVI